MEIKTEQTVELRDYLAAQFAVVAMQSQSRYRRMTLKHRIMYFLNIDGWRADYDINQPQIIRQSYEFADQMIKESKKQNNGN